MKKLISFTHSIMLLTCPALISYPQNRPDIIQYMIDYEHQHKNQEWIPPTTYDEVIQALEDIESGELEKKYSPIQIEKINDRKF